MNDVNEAQVRSVVALPGDVRAWPTLLDFLAEKFPHVSRDAWRERFSRGEILRAESCDEGSPRRALTASEAPVAHARITYLRAVQNEVKIAADELIVYQDDCILIADKPHFLPVVPSGPYVNETLLARLRKRTGLAALTPAHRIDRETAGLVLFTCQPAHRAAYQSLFAAREVTKVYEAVAPHRAALQWPLYYRSRLVDGEHFMQMKTVIGEPNAETLIELIAKLSTSHAHYRLTPKTGKRHQLRAQLCELGIPIVNDAIYPNLAPKSENAPADSAPLQLLAKRLEFLDPITRAARRFESARELLMARSTHAN